MYWGVKVSICPIDLCKGCGPERSVYLGRRVERRSRNSTAWFLSLTPIVPPLETEKARRGTRTLSWHLRRHTRRACVSRRTTRPVATEVPPGRPWYRLVPDHLAAGGRSYGSRLGCPPEGRGYVVPGLIIPVEYRWQNSGSGRCHPSTAEQLHRRPRVARERPGSVAGPAAMTLSLGKVSCRPGQLYPVVSGSPLPWLVASCRIPKGRSVQSTATRQSGMYFLYFNGCSRIRVDDTGTTVRPGFTGTWLAPRRRASSSP